MLSNIDENQIDINIRMKIVKRFQITQHFQ